MQSSMPAVTPPALSMQARYCFVMSASPAAGSPVLHNAATPAIAALLIRELLPAAWRLTLAFVVIETPLPWLQSLYRRPAPQAMGHRPLLLASCAACTVQSD